MLMKGFLESAIIPKECRSKVNNQLIIRIRVYSVMYTMDNKYVLSGSDDTNIRLWKAQANDPIKLV